MIDINKRWEESDIQELINEKREEGQYIEYKDSRALSNSNWKEDLCRDVSSFANADGGVIIYGVTEEALPEEGKKTKTIPQGFDNGMNPQEINKDTILRVLNSGTQRSVVCQIDMVSINSNAGKVAYVIKIPKSKTGPHQIICESKAYGYKYYQRNDSNIYTMQDWQIRDVMNRQSGPDLDLEFFLSSDQTFSNYRNTTFDCKISLRNSSKNPAHAAIIKLWTEDPIEFTPSPGFSTEEEGFELTGTTILNGQKRVHYYNSSVSPIFGDTTFGFSSENPAGKLHRFVLNLNKIESENIGNQIDAHIKWQIESPNMTTRFGIEKILIDTTPNPALQALDMQNPEFKVTHKSVLKKTIIDG